MGGMVRWPMLRPTCGPVEYHAIVGRILNSPENVGRYLGYVREYADVLADEGILDQLYDYGHGIKDYIADDPWFQYPSVAEYEESELGTDVRDYDEDESSYLKILAVRLQQVREQLDAIEEGSLSLEKTTYPSDALCPDWRDYGNGLDSGDVDGDGSTTTATNDNNDGLDLGDVDEDSSTTITTTDNNNGIISNVSSGASHSPWIPTIPWILASMAVTMTA